MLYAQLVGNSYRDATAQQLLKTAAIGDEFTLRRDLGNGYDANAVMVLWNDVQVGFIEKGVAAVLAPEMDQGQQFRAFVHRQDDPKKPLLRLEEAGVAGPLDAGYMQTEQEDDGETD
jgi:hypothetical protein